MHQYGIRLPSRDDLGTIWDFARTVDPIQRDDYFKKVADLLRPRMHHGTVTQYELRAACVTAVNQIRARADG